MGSEQVLRDAAGLGSTIAVTVAVVVAGSYALRRTRSMHVLRASVWRLVMTDRKCEHVPIAQAIQNRDDLIRFRHFLGQARTIDRAAAIAKWAREHDEEPGDIYDCGDLFDRERPGLRENRIPGRLGLTFRLMAWIAALLVLVFPWTLWMSHLGHALVTLKQSGEWAWLGETSIRSFWGSETLTADNCAHGVLKDIPAWPKHEILAQLCDSFATPESRNALRQSIVTTWVILGSFTITMLPLAYEAFRWAREGRIASQMLKRYAQRIAGTNAEARESGGKTQLDVGFHVTDDDWNDAREPHEAGTSVLTPRST